MPMAIMLAMMVMVEMFDRKGNVEIWRDGCKMRLMVANDEDKYNVGHDNYDDNR